MEELCECLTVTWSCDLIATYASSEISAIGDGIGEPLSGADLDFGSSPPSYYPSVIYPSGLPMVVHGGRLYGKYGGKWNVNEDKVYVMPSTIEMFVRTFLGHRFGAASQYMDDDADDGGSPCNNANDCGKCSASGVKKECILNECTCVAAFYHTAMDPVRPTRCRPTVVGMRRGTVRHRLGAAQ